MRYLVTGGAGFIGSHITESLIAGGHEVVVLDNLSSGRRENLSEVWGKFLFIEGDIRDSETCLKAAEGCNGIFHEAALVSVQDSIHRPHDNHEINITGTLHVLEAARVNGVQRVVFSSSAAIYGDLPELPKRESMLPGPKSPYALAKLSGEYYLKVYAECFGLETVALRYFNVFGRRQDPSSMYSGVISIFLERIKNGLPITIYGDGKQTRDFVNVADVVRANLMAMSMNFSAPKINKEEQKNEDWGADHSCPPAAFSFFNVATGKPTSLLDLIAVLEKICERNLDVRFADARPGDIRHSVADNSKIRKTLGYEAQVCLGDGLLELIGQAGLVRKL